MISPLMFVNIAVAGAFGSAIGDDVQGFTTFIQTSHVITLETSSERDGNRNKPSSKLGPANFTHCDQHDENSNMSYLWQEDVSGDSEYTFSLSAAVSEGFGLTRPQDAFATSQRLSDGTDDLSRFRADFLNDSCGQRLREFDKVAVLCLAKPDIWENPGCCPNWGIVQLDSCKTWCFEERCLEQTFGINVSMYWWTEFVEVDEAITIAYYYNGEHYHGPIDVISSLMKVNASVLLNDSVAVHVGSPRHHDYTMEWLEVVGITAKRVIKGNLRANHLYVPEANLHSGPYKGPSKAQLRWLQFKIWDSIGYPDIASRSLLIIMKRRERGLSNHDTDVVPLAQEYAAAHGLEVHIHSDEDLPSVREQLLLFSRAAMILAPHGAGEAFVIATLPGACVIEMFPPFWLDPVLSRMIDLLGHHYTGIRMMATKDGNESSDFDYGCNPNLPVDPSELRLAMNTCGKNAGLYSKVASQ